MHRRTRWSVACIVVLALLALLVGCAQQAPAPTAKPAAAAPTAAPAAPAPTTVPAPKPTTATAPPPVATTAPAAAPAAAAKKPRIGKVVFGTSSDIGSSDPQLQPNGDEDYYYSAVFDSLMQYDFEGKLVPDLALSYKWIDNKTLEWKLRKGVKFHNGDTFTSADVKFSVERGFTPWAAKAERTGLTKNIDRMEIVDDYTIRFYLKQPFTIFPYAISALGSPQQLLILPKNYIEKNGNEYFDKNPVGTGPFKYVSRKLGSTMSLTAFDDWWGPDPWDVTPTVKDLEFRYIPEAQTRIAALLAGDVDVVNGVQFQAIDGIKAKQGYDVNVVIANFIAVVSPNTAMTNIPDTNKPNPFRDKRVRQAMRYAIDTDSIIKNVTRSLGKKSEGPWAPPAFGAYPDRLTTKYTYNPDKAKQLLKEANFPSDMEFTHYTYESAGRPGWTEANQAADGFFRAVGMNVKTRMADVGWVLDQRRQQTVWALTSWPQMYPYLDPTRTGITTKTGLASAYTMEGDTKIDELVAAAAAATDEKERDSLWFKTYDYINETASWMPLYVQPVTYGVSPRVEYKLIPALEPPHPHRIIWKPGYPK